jgi:hypothetical protein
MGTRNVFSSLRRILRNTEASKDGRAWQIRAAATDTFRRRENNIEAVRTSDRSLSNNPNGRGGIDNLLDDIIEFDTHVNIATRATATFLNTSSSVLCNTILGLVIRGSNLHKHIFENIQYVKNAIQLTEGNNLTLDDVRKTIASIQALLSASVVRF